MPFAKQGVRPVLQYMAALTDAFRRAQGFEPNCETQSITWPTRCTRKFSDEYKARTETYREAFCSSGDDKMPGECQQLARPQMVRA